MGQLCGELSVRDGTYNLRSPDITGNKRNNEFRLARVGAPNWARVHSALISELGVTHVDVIEDASSRTVTFTLPQLAAELIMNKTETKIRTKNQNSRKLLSRLIVEQCAL